MRPAWAPCEGMEKMSEVCRENADRLYLLEE